MSTKPKRLSRVEFLKLCDTLREHKERFVSERPGNQRAAEILTSLSSISVSADSISSLKEATGVSWVFKRVVTKTRKPRRASKKPAVELSLVESLVDATVYLYQRLKWTPPADLIDFLATQRKVAESQSDEPKS